MLHTTRPSAPADDGRRLAFRPSPSTLLALLFCALAGPIFAAAEQPAGVADRGFYVGTGFGRHEIEVEFDERAAIADAGISYEATASGPEFLLGYGFGPRLRLEASAFGAEHEARPAGAKVRIGILRVSALTPLLMHGTWRPHLIAGFGVTAMPISGPVFPERTYLMTQGHFGAGLRVSIGCRLFLQGDYLRTFHDVEREFRDVDDDEELRFVGGDGRSHALRLLAAWQF
jgi:hypothetical protein